MNPRTEFERYHTALVTTATLTTLSPTNSSTRSYPRFLIGVIFASPNGQYATIKCEGNWQEQSITRPCNAVSTLASKIDYLERAVPVPADAPVTVQGYHDKGSDEELQVMLVFSRVVPNGMTPGLLRSDMEAFAAGNGAPAVGTEVTLPNLGRAPGAAKYTLVSLGGIGAGALVDLVGLKSGEISQGEYPNTVGPFAGAFSDVGLSPVPILAPPSEMVTLKGGDKFTPWAMDESAGTIRHIATWAVA